MKESSGVKLINRFVFVVTLFCLPAFLITSFDDVPENSSIYALINMLVIVKIQVGLIRYEKLVTTTKVARSGKNIIKYGLFRFY
jgi:hypothetical protein